MYPIDLYLTYRSSLRIRARTNRQGLGTGFFRPLRETVELWSDPCHGGPELGLLGPIHWFFGTAGTCVGPCTSPGEQDVRSVRCEDRESREPDHASK